jgi:hypothetical protein
MFLETPSIAKYFSDHDILHWAQSHVKLWEVLGLVKPIAASSWVDIDKFKTISAKFRTRNLIVNKTHIKNADIIDLFELSEVTAIKILDYQISTAHIDFIFPSGCTSITSHVPIKSAIYPPTLTHLKLTFCPTTVVDVPPSVTHLCVMQANRFFVNLPEGLKKLTVENFGVGSLIPRGLETLEVIGCISAGIYCTTPRSLTNLFVRYSCFTNFGIDNNVKLIADPALKKLFGANICDGSRQMYSPMPFTKSFLAHYDLESLTISSITNLMDKLVILPTLKRLTLLDPLDNTIMEDIQNISEVLPNIEYLEITMRTEISDKVNLILPIVKEFYVNNMSTNCDIQFVDGAEVLPDTLHLAYTQVIQPKNLFCDTYEYAYMKIARNHMFEYVYIKKIPS